MARASVLEQGETTRAADLATEMISLLISTQLSD